MPGNKQTTFYTTITREAEFPIEPRGRLEQVDELSGKTKEEQLLEYCQEPKSIQEILSFLKLKYSHWTHTNYIDALVDGGKLKQTIPRFKASMSQRYVAADVDIPIPTDESIIEFCKIGRRKKEIGEHFRLSMYQVKVHTDHLVADGRLKCPDIMNPKNHWQRYVSTDAPIVETDIILEMCQTPRTRAEMAERLGFETKYIRRYTEPLIQNGKLKLTIPERPTSVNQKFVIAEYEMPILSETEIIEYCNTPRLRKEVAQHFDVPQYTTDGYLLDLVKKGRLKYTIPLSPQAKQQRYVVVDFDIMVLSEEALIEFCATAKTKAEIYEHFGYSSKSGITAHITVLIERGKLAYTIPEQPKHKRQKYIVG